MCLNVAACIESIACGGHALSNADIRTRSTNKTQLCIHNWVYIAWHLADGALIDIYIADGLTEKHTDIQTHIHNDRERERERERERGRQTVSCLQRERAMRQRHASLMLQASCIYTKWHWCVVIVCDDESHLAADKNTRGCRAARTHYNVVGDYCLWWTVTWKKRHAKNVHKFMKAFQ